MLLSFFIANLTLFSSYDNIIIQEKGECYMIKSKKWTMFLKDVFICSLGAFGGPEAHYGVFTDQLVNKKQYLDEEEMVELIALCNILPGPTSTQTIVAIGHKIGGPLLALLTMLVWAMPVLVIMTLLSFMYQFMDNMNISESVVRYIGPMAVGFVVIAAYSIGKKVAYDRLSIILFLIGAGATYYIQSPWIFPLVLLIGGAASVIASREKQLWNHVKLNPPWIYLIAFLFFAIGGVIVAALWDNKLAQLFESFYRYGYLVFGGGQVVVPVMHSELVLVDQFMTNQEFLTGYGLVQGLPGPMFSFAAYAGGMAAREAGTLFQILGAAIGGIGIFLPGLLLIYFVYPIWEKLKGIRGIKVSLKGINAVAGGLIFASAITLMQRNGLALDNILVSVGTIALLATKKVPAPLVVIMALILGLL